MADQAAPTNPEGSAFAVLGRIEVDLATLRKSLGAAEAEVKTSGDRLKRVWTKQSEDVSKVVFNEGRLPGDRPSSGGGEGVGGGGGEGGGRTPASQFAHLARIIRSTLIPAMSQLNPEMGQFISAGAQSARTAVFFGGALGGIAIAATALSVAIGKYVAAAKDATAATLDNSQAIATWDASRAEAGLKRITESIAEYNLNVDQATGKVEAGFWQKLVAWTGIATEAVTGSLDAQIKKMSEYADTVAKIEAKVGIPKAESESRSAAADIVSRQAQGEIRRATDEAALTAAYNKSREAIKQKGVEQLKMIEIEADVRKSVQANMKQQGEQFIMQAANKERDKAIEATKKMGLGFDPKSETGLAHLAEIEKKYAAEKQRAADLGAKFDKNIADVEHKTDLERAKSRATAAQSVIDEEHKEQEARGRLASENEGLVQKEIDRDQKRREGVMATAKAVTDAEKVVADLRRRHIGEVEGASELEARFAADRVHAAEMSATAIEAVTQKYESQRRALQALIDAGTAGANSAEKMADIEKSGAADVAALREKHAQEESARGAKQAQERQARVQEEVALEDKRFSHFTAMGRITMQEEMGRQKRATVDPRRTLDQQEAAERELLGMRKSYADEYFRYYQSLGTSTWEDQLTSARQFLAEAITGSKEWFAAVDKVAGVYKSIHDEAKGIFSQQVSIAEAEARKEGRETMSVGDVSRYMAQVRQRDVRALGGAQVPLGEIGAAIGRKDFWKTVDREKLTPGAAFQKMQEGPQDQLAKALAETATRTAGFSGTLEQATVTSKELGDALGGMIPSLLDAAVKSRDLADAAKQAADNLRLIPPPKDENGKNGKGGGKNATSSNVLGSAGDGVYTHPGQPISSNLDTALGRNLQLANRRGVNTNESAL
jgi:hypothetical protein